MRALGYDERFVRLWEFYLAYCEAGFAEHCTGVVQMLLTRPLRHAASAWEHVAGHVGAPAGVGMTMAIRMSLPLVVLAGWLAAAALMTGLWLVQRGRATPASSTWRGRRDRRARRALFALAADGAWPRRLVVAALAAVWGVRLGVHLWTRVAREAEDGRYRQMRADWGAAAIATCFVFFQVQALWAVLFALPMLAAARQPGAAGARGTRSASLLWLVGLAGETIADRQLARIPRRARPTAAASAGSGCGATRAIRTISSSGCTGGATSRSPCRAAVVAAAGRRSRRWAASSRGSPAFRRPRRRRCAAAATPIARYQRTTSAFVPWPPRDRLQRSRR